MNRKSSRRDVAAVTHTDLLGWIGKFGWVVALAIAGLVGWVVNDRNQERFEAVQAQMTLHNESVRVELRELRADSAKVELRAMELKRVFSDYLSGSETDKGKLLGRLAEDQAILSALSKAAEGDFAAAAFTFQGAQQDGASAAAFFIYDAMGRRLNDPSIRDDDRVELRAAMRLVETKFPSVSFRLEQKENSNDPED